MGRFLRIEAAGGMVLIVATVIALVWVNSPFGDSYHELWETRVVIEAGDGDVFSIEGHDAGRVEDESAVGPDQTTADTEPAAQTDSTAEGEAEEQVGISLLDLVNDALMVIFFFVVGMEIKLELVNGQLRDRRAAALPAMAALGGMVVPALIFVAINWGGATEGWGIPMATDIAFALGVLSLLGSRVPVGIKVFLLTLAIVDDIGAILVIAVFYTTDLSFGWLAVALALLGSMAAMQRVRVWWVPIYVVTGFFVWYAVFESGVHATIAGVAMGLLTPARPLQTKPAEVGVVEAIISDQDTEVSTMRRAQFEIRETVSVAERLVEVIHPWTSFVIIPIFALANAGIELSGDSLSNAATSPVTLGVIAGLVVGKFVGVTLFSWIAIRTGLARYPDDTSLSTLAGVAAIAGIGFTVSIFIAGLAYDDVILQDEAKIGILVASAAAALIGAAMLFRSLPAGPAEEPEPEITADF